MSKRQTREIGLRGIAVLPDRMRKLKPEIVDRIAESFCEIGQQQPILVRPQKGSGYYLVAGRHRYMAARQLKWEAIRCEIIEGLDTAKAELIEIDENLMRGDLSPAEEAAHHARRKSIYLKLYPEAKRGVAGGKASGRKRSNKAQTEPRSPGYSKKAAAETGKSNASVKRAVARGEKIADVAELAGTSLDKGDELDAMAKLSAAQQRALADRARNGEKVSAKTKLKQVARQEHAEPKPELTKTVVMLKTHLG